MRGYSLLAVVTLSLSSSAFAQVERFTSQTFKPKRGEFTGNPVASAQTAQTVPIPVADDVPAKKKRR